MLGAPLVPPNQRISSASPGLSTAKTVIRYLAEIAFPRQAAARSCLEQGLGFAFTYMGLPAFARGLMPACTAPSSRRASLKGSSEATTRTCGSSSAASTPEIRFHGYGVPAIAAKPQQIPADVFADPSSVGDLRLLRAGGRCEHRPGVRGGVGR